MDKPIKPAAGAEFVETELTEFQREQQQRPTPLIMERTPADINGNASILVAYLFKTAPVRSKRYYLVQDSLLDNSIITGIEVFAYPIIFGQQIKVNDVVYNVALAQDLAAGMLTIKNSERELVIQNMPLNNLFKQPYVNSFVATGNLTAGDTQRGRRDFNISILTGESWIQFSANLATALPIAFLISFYYKPKK